jgi:hypothetical protein
MDADQPFFRRRQPFGVQSGQIDHQTDDRLGGEITTANAEAPDFDQAGKPGRRADHQLPAVGPEVHAVVADQHGGRNLPAAAGEDQVKGEARFAGP